MNVDAKDIDGDGRAELLIGAPTASDGPAAGTAYLFYTPISGALDTFDAGASFFSEHNGDELGTGVAFADINGDSSTDLVIGAPSEHTNGSQAGAIYVVMPGPEMTFLLLAAIGCGKHGDSAGCEERTFWTDADGDGHGVLGSPISACTEPANAATTSDDCDDTDPNVHPGADEICDDKDSDCDGKGDAASATWYPDEDGDGYGDALAGLKACAQPDGTVADGTDCDDADALVHPGVVEECDGDDDDCDGREDLGTVGTWYSDDDGDGYGDDAAATKTCDPDPAWVELGGDCEPSNDAVHPGAVEVCNPYDDDCDGDTLECGYAGEYELADAQTKLLGASSDDAGRLVEGGDFDGDGDEDLVVATLYANKYGGGGYVVEAPPPLGEWALEDVGVAITGAAGTLGGGRSIGVADTNDDGLDDVGFGAAWTGGDDVFVIFGPIVADMDLIDADVDLQGPDGSYTGHGHDLGDVTGDAVGDAVIGAYTEAGNRGVIYVMNGPALGHLRPRDGGRRDAQRRRGERLGRPRRPLRWRRRRRRRRRPARAGALREHGRAHLRKGLRRARAAALRRQRARRRRVRAARRRRRERDCRQRRRDGRRRRRRLRRLDRRVTGRRRGRRGTSAG